MNAPPVFPDKRPIELEDKPLFDGYFRRFPPVISEYTFTNLFAWRHAYGFCVSLLDDVLVVSAHAKEGARFFDPVGPAENKQRVIERCFSAAGAGVAFCRLPEATAQLFSGSKGFRVAQDRDNFDYLYRRSDLTGLKGRAYDGKRNFIKRFKDAYAFTYKKVTKENVRQCLFFEEEWCLAKDCVRSEGLTREKQALQEMLDNFETLGMAGGMIEVNGKVEAVTLGERLNPETFVIHIEKANGALIGIYQAINQAFCEAEAASCAYVNREQDLGVAGLRQSKESYHPCAMVKKYTLTRA